MATYGDWSEIWAILQRNAVPTRGSPHVTEQAKIYADVEVASGVIYLPAWAVNIGGRAVIPEGSEDGNKLEAIGCFIDDDSDRWAIHP